MSTVRTYEIFCDTTAPGCPTPTVTGATIAAAREAARKAGWKVQLQGGKHIDKCPVHKVGDTPKGATGKCPVCEQPVRLNIGGVLRSHKAPQDPAKFRRYRQRCEGSYRKPNPAEAPAAVS